VASAGKTIDYALHINWCLSLASIEAEHVIEMDANQRNWWKIKSKSDWRIKK
jgi:hypothetical protein